MAAIRAHFFTTPSGEEMTILPAADFRAMEKVMEDLSDINAVTTFRERLAAGEEELIPAEFANRILDGENKIRVWREYRGLTARDLAAKAEISGGYLSQIESGDRDGSFDTIKKIAAALGISVDDLA
jgi:DNA-binding XRE family transcriptional regulator